jgi:flagellar biogenesis protein FliO
LPDSASLTTNDSAFIADYVSPNVSNFSNYSSFSWLGFMLNLFLILVLIYVAVFILKWVLSNRSTGAVAQVVKTIPLRPSSALVYLDHGTKIYVLGVTDHHVSVVDTITDEKEMDDIRLGGALSQGAKTAFTSLADRLFKKKKPSFEPLINRSIESILRESNDLEKIN